MHPAVVLGGDVNSLGHVRSLGKAGIATSAICSGPHDPAYHSKYCIAETVPDNAEDYECRLVETLIKVARAQKAPPVLYASSDYFVAFIARHRALLASHYLFNIAGDESLRVVSDKSLCHEAARQAGLNTPLTYMLTDLASKCGVQTSLRFPCIVKPKNSYSHVFPWKNLTLRDGRELDRFLVEFPDLINHAIIQEIIPGDETAIFQCTTYFGRQTPAQFFTLQKIHQFPPGYGTTTLGISRHMPDLIEHTSAVLQHLGYSGFASVEFKWSVSDGRYYLIEINPRLPWYNGLFYACGINFPAIAHEDMTGPHPEQPQIVRQIENVYWLHLRNEIAGGWRRCRTGGIASALRGWATALRARSHAHFDVTDLKPCIAAYSGFVRRELGRLRPGRPAP